jgi:hypothetical protein
MTTFYCVWWTDGDVGPEDQLMGIHSTEEDAKVHVYNLGVPDRDNEKIYYTVVTVNEYGET